MKELGTKWWGKKCKCGGNRNFRRRTHGAQASGTPADEISRRHNCVQKGFAVRRKKKEQYE